MNPILVMVAWAGAGMIGAIVLPRVRRRRWAVVVPAAGLLAALMLGAGTAPALSAGALELGQLGRAGQGLAVAMAASMTLTVLLSPTLDGPETLTIGIAGAASALALSTGSVALRAVALMVAVAAVGLRWIAAAPGRLTLAAGRVGGGAAAALTAAAVFLPVTGLSGGPRPALAAILLACGVAGLLGQLPVGGWAVAGFVAVRGIDVAVWQLLIVPVVLVTAGGVATLLPDPAAGLYNQILLISGLVTAVWNGLLALRTPAAARYGRVVIADLGLAVAAIGSGHVTAALSGVLLLILTHLVVAPLLLHPPEPSRLPPQRAAWALLSGLPPAPSFWARFTLLEALVQAGSGLMLAAVPAMAAVFVAAVLAALPSSGVAAPARGERLRLPEVAGWVLVAAALALGLVPAAVTTFVFGTS